MTGTDNVTFVSQEDYDALVNSLQDRRKAVAKAQHKLAKAKTLAEKIELQRALKKAREL